MPEKRKMRCSLCRGIKEGYPLDMEDPVFGTYARIMRRSSLAKTTGEAELGICKKCMPAYRKMEAEYRKKLVMNAMAAVLLGGAYLLLTSNIAISVLIAAVVISLSLLSYCPPLVRH